MTLPIPIPNYPDSTLLSNICDVAAFLANEDRVSVLLYAMEHLPIDTKYVTHH
jgi:hypothetical protein